MRKVTAAAEALLPLLVGAAVAIQFRDTASTIAATHIAFLLVALHRGWPRPSWLRVEAVEEALVKRSAARIRLVNRCKRGRRAAGRPLEQWEYSVDDLAQQPPLRDYLAASFQLAEAKAVLVDTKSTLLRSALVSIIAAFLAVSISVVPVPSAAKGSSPDAVRTIVSIVTGFVSPAAQLTFLFGSCLFVYKRNEGFL